MRNTRRSTALKWVKEPAMTHGPAASRKVGDDFMLMDSEGRLLATVRGMRSPVYDKWGTYKRTTTHGWKVLLFENRGQSDERMIRLYSDGASHHGPYDARRGFDSLPKAKAAAKREVLAYRR